MMVYGFQNPIVSAFYILAMFLLALHLSHGASSFFQSLGLNDKKLAPRLERWGRIFAWLIFRRIHLDSGGGPARTRPARATVMIGSLDAKVPPGPLGDQMVALQGSCSTR